MNKIKNIIESKRFAVILLIIIVLVFITVSILKMDPINGRLVCTLYNKSDTLEVKSKTTIDFKMRNVTSLETVEIIKSEESDLIKNQKDSLDLLSDKFKDLKYYNYNSKIKNNELVIETKINYDKIDMKKYLDIEGEKTYIKNNKVSIKKLNDIYIKNGAKCHYK